MRRCLLLATLILVPASSGFALDLSPLHGYWLPANEGCVLSDLSLSIDGTGASSHESKCTLVKATKKGSTYRLIQQCSAEGEPQKMVVDIKLVTSRHIEIYGTRLKRCPRPEG